MRRNCLAVSCLGLTIIFLTGLARAQSEQAKQITCTGKVVNDQNQPITGVKVTLYEIPYNEATYTYDSKLDSEADTGIDGVFSFSISLESDAFRYGYIVAEKEGLALGFDNWNMQEGDKELEIRLGEPKELAGTIVDENGMPVSDAQVTISMLVIGQKEERKSLTGLVNVSQLVTNTDSAGRFKFTGIPAEAMAELLIKKTGRATVSTYQRSEYGEQGLKFTPGGTDIKVALPIEAKIEGIVVEKSTGKPVGGVKVMVWSDQDIVYFRQKPVASNPDGTFSFIALASDRYILELVRPVKELPDWIAEPVEVITESGKTQNGVKIELSKGGVLEVVVKDAISKQPVEKANVGIQHDASGRYVSSSSGDDGVARMRLLPGEYRLNMVYKQGYSRQNLRDPVTIENGETERLEYNLVGVPKITGVVRDEKGEPVKGAKLRICPGGGDGAVSDAEGKFESVLDIGGWPSSEPPVMFLVGRYEEGNLAAAVQIEEEARTVDITLKPGVIFSGKVVDPDNKGIAGAAITIMLQGPRWGSSISRDRITSDVQGRFEVKTVPSDQKYSLYVIAEGYGENRSEEISAGDAVNYHLDLGNVTLPVANLLVSGVVVDSNDKPVAGARLYCYGEGQSRSRTQTDANGKFTLEKVCAGRIRISADKTGTARLYGSIETEGGATDVRIVISQRPSSTRYEPKRPASLVGRPLPELKEAGIDLPPADTDGKIMLVCFIDMEQRPSRHCVTQLVKQAEQLKGKGVTIVAVQASKMDQEGLTQWKNQYKIPFPVGMIQGDAEKARFSWGIRSLPWLILTDSGHIIRSAGFQFNQLNEKIGEVGNVER